MSSADPLQIPLDSVAQGLLSALRNEGLFLPLSYRSEDLSTYCRDLWPRNLLSVGIPKAPAPKGPDLVVWPRSTAEVAQVVRLCREQKVPITPYGAGSGVCGGALARSGVVLDLKRMRKVISIDPGRHTVTFQPGILGEHLEQALARRGFTLGHFPSSIMCSTAGGWIATRGAGQCSTKYGKIEDMVQSVEFVCGKGKVHRLRQGEGPDLLQLLVGSEGTLGILTEATCAIRPAPSARRMRGWSFPSVNLACDGIRRILQEGIRPSVVRLYDELDTLISGAGRSQDNPESFLPATERADQSQLELAEAFALGERPTLTMDDWVEMLRPDVQRAGRGIMRWVVSRALSKPGMINRLADRLVPKLASGCLLILGFEGAEDLTFTEERVAAQLLAGGSGKDLGPGPGEHWLKNRYHVSFKMPRAFASGAFVDTMEVATGWDHLLPLYAAVRRAVSPHAFVMAHFSHAYVDGCSIYFTFAGRRRAALSASAEAVAEDEARYDAMWNAALSAVVAHGGTISHHHGVGLLKAPFMDAEHGPAMSVYRAWKRVLDPDNVLNPGKMGLPAGGLL